MWVVLKNEFYKSKRQAKHFVFIVLTLLFQVAALYFIQENFIPMTQEAFYNLLLKGNSFLIFLLGILYVASVFTEDMKQGTIKMSLVQPMNRLSVFMGKWIYVFLILILMGLFTFITGTLLSTLVYGLPDLLSCLTALRGVLMNSLVYMSFLSILMVFAFMIDIPAVIVTVGIMINLLLKPILNILVSLDKLSDRTLYFFVTEHFDLYFNSLPDFKYFWAIAAVGVLVPLCVGSGLSYFLFKKKDVHF